MTVHRAGGRRPRPVPPPAAGESLDALRARLAAESAAAVALAGARVGEAYTAAALQALRAGLARVVAVARVG